MTITITGNIVEKDIDVDPIVAHTGFYDVIVTNNNIKGDLKIRPEGIYSDIQMDHCDFRMDLKYFSPQVWFIYHNFFVWNHDMKRVLDDYVNNNQAHSLSFNYYPGVSTNLPKLAIDCLEFLKEYYDH